MKRILFVCMGNVCRSPAAEGVARALVMRTGFASSIEVASAGTHAYHEGETPDPRVRQIASARGYDLKGIRARRITGSDFERFDRILAMDLQNLEFLKRRCLPEHVGKIGLFLAHDDGFGVTEVPDPYYGNSEGFERVFDMCEVAARRVISETITSCPSTQSDPPTRAFSDNPS